MNKTLGWFLGILLLVFVAFLLYIAWLTPCSPSEQIAKGMVSGDFTVFECHKLYLSFGVLFAVVMMLLLSAGLYVFVRPTAGQEDPAKNVFDTFSKVLLPIATLILGYYFGTGALKAPPAGKSSETAVDKRDGPSEAKAAPAAAGPTK